MTTKPEIQETLALSIKVAACRDKAREILRGQAINRILTVILQEEKCLTSAKEYPTNYTKEVARTEYALSKLDPKDPDYAEKKTNTEKAIESRKKDLERATKQSEADSERYTQNIESYKKEIAKWETGEYKVSMDSMESLANELIKKDI